MNCDEFREKAIEYEDNALGAVERHAFEEHAGRCAECGQYLGEVRGVFAALRGAEPADPGDLFWKRLEHGVSARMRDEAVAARKRRSLSHIAAAGLAAAVIFVASFAGLRMMNSNIKPGAVQQTAAVSQHESEILMAALQQGVAIPKFSSLYKDDQGDITSSENAAEDMDEIIESGVYSPSPRGSYKIPSMIEDISEEEAERLLEAMPGQQDGSLAPGESLNGAS